MQSTSEPVSDTSAILINIYVDARLVYSTELDCTLELGRQHSYEPAPYARLSNRVVIAELQESSVSRRHISLRLEKDNVVRVTNHSSVNSVLIGTDHVLKPEDYQDVELPCLLSIGKQIIQLRLAEDEQEEKFESFTHRTTPPGQLQPFDSSITDVLTADRGLEEMRDLLRGVHATTEVFNKSSSSSEFLSAAAQAMIDIVDVETSAALIWKDRGWSTEAICCRDSASERTVSRWEPSQTILRRVQQDSRTFWASPQGSETDSLAEVNVVIAAPILDVQGQVLGVLYGDRRKVRRGKPETKISEVKAILTELLASSAASGIARLEQQQAANKAKVLFDQFFTPELSQQLEANPKLLHGKDTEVTLLCCEIHGFSKASERLGTRLTLDWINDVMGTLSGCISDNRGVLVDALGDELVGMWGAPVELADHASLACRAAIMMTEKLAGLNRRWQDTFSDPIEIGIGIHTGVARVGNIGSAKKFQYGPIGSTVSRTQCVKNATRYMGAQVLVTAETATQLDESFQTRRLGQVLESEKDLDVLQLATDLLDTWVERKRYYETALDAIERGDRPTAIRLLAKVLAAYPDDHPSLLLMSRISRMPGSV